MELLNDLYGDKELDLPQFKVDIYELHNFEKDYDYPDSAFQFTIHLYKALSVADIGNFEKLAAVYPEEAYTIAYKEKPQFLHYFILWDTINEKSVDSWK